MVLSFWASQFTKYKVFYYARRNSSPVHDEKISVCCIILVTIARGLCFFNNIFPRIYQTFYAVRGVQLVSATERDSSPSRSSLARIYESFTRELIISAGLWTAPRLGFLEGHSLWNKSPHFQLNEGECLKCCRKQLPVPFCVRRSSTGVATTQKFIVSQSNSIFWKTT